MIETYDDLFVKQCMRCHTPTPTDREEGDVYCQKCASPLANRCTNISDDNFSNYEGCGVALKPEAVYCPKCATISLFAREQLIENKYPKVELVSNFEDDEPVF
ncbi:hypothetical protein BTO30_14145 [Domibacillus antri]|uniref:DZANK-type domain-containing protein n=1 Tax=Domibacillus antri TaxID=1714264 RepID=A0A1Q8Q2R8_9BACI|nr:hypothetical protein [Domibacillus antri]OLN21618.1 hypothetical protein BTO30_14145 [Domibacillus antri]